MREEAGDKIRRCKLEKCDKRNAFNFKTKHGTFPFQLLCMSYKLYELYIHHQIVMIRLSYSFQNMKKKFLTILSFLFLASFKQDYCENWRWNVVVLLQRRHLFAGSKANRRGSIWYHFNGIARSLTILMLIRVWLWWASFRWACCIHTKSYTSHWTREHKQRSSFTLNKRHKQTIFVI